MHPRSNLEIDGVEVHVEGSGEDTIVMLHGWPDTLRLWDGQVAALAPQWRCVRFTLPGFDRTRPPRSMSVAAMNRFLLAVVDAVSPDRPVTLLLHDWGCIYGMQFARVHPDRVARIVAVDVGDVPSRDFTRSLTPRTLAMIAAYQWPLAFAWLLPGSLGDAMTRRVARGLRCPTDPATIGAHMNAPYARSWTGGFLDAKPFQPHCPVLYLYGTRKPFMFHSPQWLERVAALPGGAVQPLRTGHWVMVQAPEEFNRLVVDWLHAQAG